MNIRYKREAVDDLDDIYSYFVTHEGPEFADNITTELFNVIDGIDRLGFEHRGNYVKELLYMEDRKYRELHHKVFRIMYTIVDDDIVIIAVLDGRRDIATVIKERLEKPRFL